ncbi:MAG: UDP-glucose 4-epimerase GalE [Flavobacteriales bacterium]|nr:UDP-glucose 4-epimerase GalE [Flavobacteriales bacterium]
MQSSVLITGGLGYIGSHTVVAMMEAGYEVVVIDSLANSRLEVLERIGRIVGRQPKFKELDLCDQEGVEAFFESADGANISAVIHFAAYKNVGESVANPLKYYNNNIGSLVNTLSSMNAQAIPYFVFSSSCSVYGNAAVIPVTETTPLQPAESPYGNTKKIGEEIIADAVKGTTVQAISLRYFNPIGAHSSNEIGEFPSTHMDNLIPALMSTARGDRSHFSVYGNDYNTADGSCVRDYIDIMDLAAAHVKAVERLLKKKNQDSYEVFNLGTGKGVSVLEMIAAAEQVTGTSITYEVQPRREGDVEAIYADPQLANEQLEWAADRSLENMMATAWAWSGALMENTESNE